MDKSLGDPPRLPIDAAPGDVPPAPGTMTPAPGTMTPAPGTMTEVAAGIHWARLPLPFALDHINVWLLRDGRGWTVVDTGLNSRLSREYWQNLFDHAPDSLPISRVIATHFHPDHIGLAGWLVEHRQAEFATSLTEWLFARMLSRDDPAEIALAMAGFYRRAGVDDAALAVLTGRAGAYAASVWRLPPAFRRLRNGDRLLIGEIFWDVITAGGHTPEHVCLSTPDRHILIAGDMVLPRISPNISVWASEPDADPLTEFLAGLDRLRSLPDDTLILPSHGNPFQGLHRRIDDLAGHHAARLDDTITACRQPRTAAEVTRHMFDRVLDGHQLMFALGEAIAHLNHLVARGKVHRWLDEQGIHRYQCA